MILLKKAGYIESFVVSLVVKQRKEKNMTRLIDKYFGTIVSVEPTEKSKDDEGWIRKTLKIIEFSIRSIRYFTTILVKKIWLWRNYNLSLDEHLACYNAFINGNNTVERFILLSPLPLLTNNKIFEN